METKKEFFSWERSSKDTIDFKTIYVDIAGGDILAGLTLSQIVYWHLPSKSGKSKLQVKKRGVLWLAIRRVDWWDQTRLTPRQADRAIGILIKKGLVEKAVFKFFGEPTTHLRLIYDGFLKALDEQINYPALNPLAARPQDDIEDAEIEDGEDESYPGATWKSPMGENRLPKEGGPVTETSSETTSEITPPPQTGMPKQRDPMRKQQDGGGGVLSEDELIEHEQKYPGISKLLDQLDIHISRMRLGALRCGDRGYSEFDLRLIRDRLNDDPKIRNLAGAFLSNLPRKQNDKAPCTKEEYSGVPVYEDSDRLRAKYEQKYPELNHVLLNLGIRNKYCLAALRYGDYGYSGSDLQTAWDNAEDSSSNHLQEDRFLEELSRLKANNPAIECS
jgi:hypothetical protein